MLAKRTIRELENRVYNNEKSVCRLINEWNRTVVPARDELYRFNGDEYLTERDIIDEFAEQLDAYTKQILDNKEKALGELRRIKNLPSWKRIWMA